MMQGMNSKQFLELVEKHGLPWRIQYPTHDGAYGWLYTSSAGIALEDGREEATASGLADAAPAMAAAILGFLKRHDAVMANLASHGSPVGPEPIAEALRTSLPEELRP